MCDWSQDLQPRSPRPEPASRPWEEKRERERESERERQREREKERRERDREAEREREREKVLESAGERCKSPRGPVRRTARGNRGDVPPPDDMYVMYV